MSDWYDKTNVPATRASLSSSVMRNEYALIDTAMAKLPALTGNGNKFCIVNSAGTAIESTSSLVSTDTTSTVLTVSGNSLTTGGILDLTSDSSSTGARNLVRVVNDNTAATGAKCLALVQDSTSEALFIDSNGNGTSINIDSEATTASIISTSAVTLTTGDVFSCIDADALTSGSMLNLISDSAATNTRYLVDIVNENSLATGATTLRLRQDAAAIGVFLDQNGNNTALSIDSESTTPNVLLISSMTTSGNIITCNSAPSLTTGSMLFLSSNSSDTGTRYLANIINDDTAATGATVLRLQQDAAATAMSIAQSGAGTALDITSGAISQNIIQISALSVTSGNIFSCVDADSLLGGSMLKLTSDSANTTARYLVDVTNDNTLATSTRVIRLVQDAAETIMVLDHNSTSAGCSFIDFQATAAANAVNPISTLTTSGATTHHIQGEVNGTKGWFAFSTNDPS